MDDLGLSLRGDGVARVGRNASCDIVMTHPSISSVHCKFDCCSSKSTAKEDRSTDPPGSSSCLCVTDVSSNGTWLLRFDAGEEEEEEEGEDEEPKQRRGAKLVKLEKGARVSLEPSDRICLLHPKHRQSDAFKLIVEKDGRSCSDSERDGWCLRRSACQSSTTSSAATRSKPATCTPPIPRASHNTSASTSSPVKDVQGSACSSPQHAHAKQSVPDASAARPSLQHKRVRSELGADDPGTSVPKKHRLEEDKPDIKVDISDVSEETSSSPPSISLPPAPGATAGAKKDQDLVSGDVNMVHVPSTDELVHNIFPAKSTPHGEAMAKEEDGEEESRHELSQESCPNCGLMLPLVELVLHCEKCVDHGASAGAANTGEFDGDAIEESHLERDTTGTHGSSIWTGSRHDRERELTSAVVDKIPAEEGNAYSGVVTSALATATCILPRAVGGAPMLNTAEAGKKGTPSLHDVVAAERPGTLATREPPAGSYRDPTVVSPADAVEHSSPRPLDDPLLMMEEGGGGGGGLGQGDGAWSELSEEGCPYCGRTMPPVDLVEHCEECQRMSDVAEVLESGTGAGGGDTFHAAKPTTSSSGSIATTCGAAVQFRSDDVHVHVGVADIVERDVAAIVHVGAGSSSKEWKEGYSECSGRELGSSASVGRNGTETAAVEGSGRGREAVQSHVEGAAMSAGGLDSCGDELEQCQHCLEDFPLCQLLLHVECCPKRELEEAWRVVEEEQCQHCLKVFPLEGLVAHSLTCSQRNRKAMGNMSWEGGVEGSQEVWGEPVERCIHCFRDFPISVLVGHSAKCQGDLSGSRKRLQGFTPSVHDLDATAMAVLNDTQMAAIDYVVSSSARDSSVALPNLKKRVSDLGYSETDLERTLQWVKQEAPIIIHVNLDRALGFLVEDTHYRNQFETHTSGGSTDLSARSSWEDRIFNRLYSGSCPFDRVKYGVLNIVGDPHGVSSCYSYGDSFLQLKKVRLRTTFASMDTSSGTVKLSCCEHYANVLNEYSNSELKAILDVATRRSPFLKSNMITAYKEIQIHGPVCLSENVECIVVNHRHHGNHHTETLLNRFVERNGCNLIWMDPEDHTHLVHGPTPGPVPILPPPAPLAAWMGHVPTLPGPGAMSHYHIPPAFPVAAGHVLYPTTSTHGHRRRRRGRR